MHRLVRHHLVVETKPNGDHRPFGFAFGHGHQIEAHTVLAATFGRGTTKAHDNKGSRSQAHATIKCHNTTDMGWPGPPEQDVAM